MNSNPSENQPPTPRDGECLNHSKMMPDLQGENSQDDLLHLGYLCHVWIAPDGTIHAQNLTRPLAQILSQVNPADSAMRIRAQGSSPIEQAILSEHCRISPGRNEIQGGVPLAPLSVSEPGGLPHPLPPSTSPRA